MEKRTEELIRRFRAKIKALGIKQWNKNVWAVENCAEDFLKELDLHY